MLLVSFAIHGVTVMEPEEGFATEFNAQKDEVMVCFLLEVPR